MVGDVKYLESNIEVQESEVSNDKTEKWKFFTAK